MELIIYQDSIGVCRWLMREVRYIQGWRMDDGSECLMRMGCFSHLGCEDDKRCRVADPNVYQVVHGREGDRDSA